MDEQSCLKCEHIALTRDGLYCTNFNEEVDEETGRECEMYDES